MSGISAQMAFIKKHRKYIFLAASQLILVAILLRLTWSRGHLQNGYMTSDSASIFRPGEFDEQTKVQRVDVDVHFEGVAGVNHVHKSSSGLVTVAIGLALTSRFMYNVTEDNLRYKFPFFRSLLPSFCKTSTQGYSYQFYVAFDADDPFFTRQESFEWFSNVFDLFRREICGYVTEMQLHLIECTHSHKPAWAQNDAMMEAYLDHVDYFYRVNDDTLLQSPGWTERYIHALNEFDPPLVGVVGPEHGGGKLNILAYDFVHRTHIDIFGFYYPRLFTDWFADDWITTVYQANRTEKVAQVKVIHTLLLGRRYENIAFGNAQYLKQQLNFDQDTLRRYLERMKKHSPVKKDPGKVIAMELTSSETNYVHGAIRNVHLEHSFLPEWTVRIYTREGVLSPRILRKLNQSDATVIAMPIPSDPWRTVMLPYMVASDITVKYFLIRDVLGRITQRDCDLINDWLHRHEPFFCARDHPTLHHTPLIPGLFGANTAAFHELSLYPSAIERKIKDTYQSDKNQYYNFSQPYIPYASYNTSAYRMEDWYLNELVWPKIKDKTTCYDSVHCSDWLKSGHVRPFPDPRINMQFVGEHFGAFEVPVDFNVSRVLYEYEKNCSLTEH